MRPSAVAKRPHRQVGVLASAHRPLYSSRRRSAGARRPEPVVLPEPSAPRRAPSPGDRAQHRSDSAVRETARTLRCIHSAPDPEPLDSSRPRTRSESRCCSARRRAASRVLLEVAAIRSAPRRGLVERGEGKKPLAALAERVVEAGVLDQRRPPAGQVGGGAVAEPAAPGFDVDALGDRELRPRAAHVVAKCLWGCSDITRIDDPPAVTSKCLQILGVARMDVEGDLEAGAVDTFGELDHPSHLMVLQAHLAISDPKATIGAAPCRDRGEARRTAGRRPPLATRRARPEAAWGSTRSRRPESASPDVPTLSPTVT